MRSPVMNYVEPGRERKSLEYTRQESDVGLWENDKRSPWLSQGSGKIVSHTGGCTIDQLQDGVRTVGESPKGVSRARRKGGWLC